MRRELSDSFDEWVDFKKTFTQKQEDAIWQYFIDHARVLRNGYFRIIFHVKDVDDFWQRLYTRYAGEFMRQKYEKLERASSKASFSLKIMNDRANMFGHICEHIDKQGTIVQKLLLWLYRRTRDRLLKVKTG